MNCDCGTPLTGKQTKYCSRKCHAKSTNYKFQNYECQKERALKRKKWLVQKAGGACLECGYKKNLAALEFHHINKEEKEFQIDSRRLSNATLDKILKEFDKCKLLCSNCHREIHHPDSNM